MNYNVYIRSISSSMTTKCILETIQNAEKNSVFSHPIFVVNDMGVDNKKYNIRGKLGHISLGMQRSWRVG